LQIRSPAAATRSNCFMVGCSLLVFWMMTRPRGPRKSITFGSALKPTPIIHSILGPTLGRMAASWRMSSLSILGQITKLSEVPTFTEFPSLAIFLNLISLPTWPFLDNPGCAGVSARFGRRSGYARLHTCAGTGRSQHPGGRYFLLRVVDSSPFCAAIPFFRRGWSLMTYPHLSSNRVFPACPMRPPKWQGASCPVLGSRPPFPERAAGMTPSTEHRRVILYLHRVLPKLSC